MVMIRTNSFQLFANLVNIIFFEKPYLSINEVKLLGENIPYTNWGITGNVLEPLKDPNKLCASMCVGLDCTDNSWRAEACSNQMTNFICQANGNKSLFKM